MIFKSLIYQLKRLYIIKSKGGVVYARRIGVKVGQGCRLYTTRYGSEPFLIEIGDRVTITSGVILLTHDGSTWLIRDEKGRRYLYRKIVIGSDVFIGVNSIIMPGVVIGNNVIVGAGSVVTKSLPSGVIVAGNPARIIGRYDDYKNNVLEQYVSDKDIDKTIPYKERILKVLDSTIKKELI